LRLRKGLPQQGGIATEIIDGINQNVGRLAQERIRSFLGEHLALKQLSHVTLVGRKTINVRIVGERIQINTQNL
jgi:hypothetical protein